VIQFIGAIAKASEFAVANGELFSLARCDCDVNHSVPWPRKPLPGAGAAT